MNHEKARLEAVIGALKDVRAHMLELDGEHITVADYNRWVERLNTLVEGDWDALVLDGGEEGTVPAEDMLMNIDAAIAFLEDHRAAAYAMAS